MTFRELCHTTQRQATTFNHDSTLRKPNLTYLEGFVQVIWEVIFGTYIPVSKRFLFDRNLKILSIDGHNTNQKHLPVPFN